MVVAIDLANSSAKRAFALSIELISGTATHRIVGGRDGVPHEIYARMRTELGLRNTTPGINGQVDISGQPYELIGIDPFAGSLNASLLGTNFDSDLDKKALPSFLSPRTALLASTSAETLGLVVGDEIQVIAAGHAISLTLIGLLTTDHPAARDGVLIADIAVAQEVLGRGNMLDHINLIITDNDQLRIIEQWLPTSLNLVSLSENSDAINSLTQSFYTNLSAMSLLALLVGGFLIYNTITFGVLRRRAVLGIMRSLGTRRNEIISLILGEALLLGFLASALGIVCGILIGQELVKLVTRTIDDLYFKLHVSQLFLDHFSIAKGLMLGMGVTLLAAILPAKEATYSPPISTQQDSALEGKYIRYLPRLLCLGLLMMAAGCSVIWLMPANLVLGFIALALLVFGFSLLIPSILHGLLKLTNHILFTRSNTNLSNRGFHNRVALRGTANSLSRTALAVAALSIAVATTVGVEIMISSFRLTVQDWLEQSFTSDMLVTNNTSESLKKTDIKFDIAQQLAALPVVHRVIANRIKSVYTDHGQIRLIASTYDPEIDRGFNLKVGSEDKVHAAFSAGTGVLISEPLAFRSDLKLGDFINFDTPGGELNLPVLGIFYDYTTSGGMVVMLHSLYREYWGDEFYSSLAIYKEPEVLFRNFVQRINEYLENEAPQLGSQSSLDIKTKSLEIFDRTFAITEVLRFLAIGVAFIGILSTLLALQLERGKDYAILRALGSTRGEISRIVLTQTAIMGIFAGLFAIPMGLIMAVILIKVINLQAFGWSIQFVIPASSLWSALMLALGSALLAGLYPAWRAGRQPIASQLRNE